MNDRLKHLLEVEMAALRLQHAGAPVDDLRPRPADLLSDFDAVDAWRRLCKQPIGGPARSLSPHDPVEEQAIVEAWREITETAA